MTKPRGIANVTHVSCHLNCALQILLHATELLRELLIKYSRHRGDNSGFLIELGDFFRNGLIEEGSEPSYIDPSNLYGLLQTSVSIDPHDLGDAVTAFRRILQAIRRRFSGLDGLSDLMEKLFGGSVLQEIVGFKGNKQRAKSVSRKLTLPFIVSGNALSLQEALLHATIKPQHPIKDYTWGETGNYIETEMTAENNLFVSDEDAKFDKWRTYKKIWFERVPQYLPIHLQRFSIIDGTATPVNTIMEIPLILDISTFYKTQLADACNEFHLCGAILHVWDLKEQEVEEGDENGHYVCLVLVDNVWYLIDDEIVVAFESNQEMIEILEGRCSTFAHLEYCRFITVLVTYQHEKNRDKESWREEFMKEMNCKFTKMSPTGDFEGEDRTLNTSTWDQSLLGKRLRVRWSKGTYYRGIILNYNAETGRHTVQYDDGEVRVYKLSEKTIEWE